MQTNKQNKKKNGGGLGTRLGSPHMETANSKKLDETWEQGYLNDLINLANTCRGMVVCFLANNAVMNYYILKSVYNRKSLIQSFGYLNPNHNDILLCVKWKVICFAFKSYCFSYPNISVI